MSEMCKSSGHRGTLYLAPAVHFLHGAEGQGEDHCPERQEKWIGPCCAAGRLWGAG